MLNSPVRAFAGAPRHPAARRSRALYAGLVVLTIALGLASRTSWSPLPTSIATVPGDVLWATMVFLALAALWNGARTRALAWVTLAIAWGVEVSQLLSWDWLDALRATTPGRLALGSGFVWADLLWYALGVGLGVAVDVAVRRRARRAR